MAEGRVDFCAARCCVLLQRTRSGIGKTWHAYGTPASTVLPPRTMTTAKARREDLRAVREKNIYERRVFAKQHFTFKNSRCWLPPTLLNPLPFSLAFMACFPAAIFAQFRPPDHHEERV